MLLRKPYFWRRLSRGIVLLAAYLDPNVSVKLDHVTTLGVVHDARFSITVGVSLGMVTRDVIEVSFVGEIQKEVVTAGGVDCRQRHKLVMMCSWGP